MSYQPPSQPGGDQPPSDQGQGGSSSGGDYSSQGNYTQPIGGQGSSGGGGSYTPPPGGGYTPPPSGGGGGEYAPPPGGGYTPPPSGGGGGGYTPPPGGGGGYSPPPGGGYTPPPGGGYNQPPPGGGYNPPPQGGYGAPPPPPQGGYNVNMSSLNRNVAIGNTSLNPGQLLQSYINAVTKPNPGTYEAEMGNASWVKVFVGIAIVAVIGFIFSLIASATAMGALNSQLDQLRAQGQGQLADAMRGLTFYSGGSPFFSLIAPFITFFLGAGLQYLFAKMLGGQGNDFMVHSYLVSLSYTPLRVIGSVLSIIPIVGGCVTFLATLYQIYSVGLSMQASQRMQSGRAQLAAWLPLVVFILLFCVCIVAFAGLIASIVNTAGSNP